MKRILHFYACAMACLLVPGTARTQAVPYADDEPPPGGGSATPLSADLGTCEIGGTPCSDPQDCDDDNPCTNDTCHPDGFCVFTPLADGTSCDDGVSQTEDSRDEETQQRQDSTGACCLWPQRGCLQDLTQEVCEETLGGIYAGDGTVCFEACELGACCYTDGACEVLIETQCLDSGAQWQGPESGCEPNPCPLPIGACCLSGGCVPDQELIECLNSGGQWAGPDTDCSAPGICEDGACCIGDACVVNPEPNCLSVGGWWAGLFTDCSNDCNSNGIADACDMPGDFDGDNTITIGDFHDFSMCLTGPFGFHSDPCCLLADFDQDRDVDLRDFGLMQLVFSSGSQGSLAVAVYANPTTVIVGDPAPPAPPFAVELSSVIDGTPVSYAWSQIGGPGTGAPEADARFEDPTAANTTWHPGPDPGSYVLELEVTDAIPLTASDVVTITVVEAMSGDISAAPGTTVSVYQIVTLNLPVSGGVGQKSFNWNFDSVPGGSVLTDADFVAETSVPTSFMPDVVGTYNISCTVTDEGGNIYQPTIAITANEALAIDPSVEVNSIDGVTCIVGLPAMGEGDMDPDHVLAILNAHLSGGVAPYTFTWEVTASPLWDDPVLVDPVNGTAEWDIPSGVTSTLPVTFSLTVRDATLYEVDADVVVSVAPPVRLTGIFPDPAVGTTGDPLQLTFFRDLTSGTGTVLFELAQEAGPGFCTLPPQDVFDDPAVAAITCDTDGVYDLSINFTDDCSDAVVSVDFTVTMDPP